MHCIETRKIWRNLLNIYIKKALILNPFLQHCSLNKTLSFLILFVLDCSWNRSEHELKIDFLSTHVMGRRLPAMLQIPSITQNWEKPYLPENGSLLYFR